ncbi:MAG: FemAB family PEP-CTERM system-associated protein [Sphingomonadaceae bacterium]|nr:FemAB family PEP-CTERM system-associated protein [Sphingomonadaceae bacterium]
MNAPARIPLLAIATPDLDDPEQARRIEAFVRASPGGTPFHLPRWLAAVEQGTRQRVHCLIAERGETILGLLPLTEIRSRLFGDALVSSGFATGGGILAEDDRVAEALAEAAWSLAQKLGCPDVELRGGPIPSGWERREGVYADFAKPLAASDEEELARIRRRQRAEVRKGLENKLEFRMGTSPRDRDMHYAVYAESVRNLGSPVFPRALFESVLDAFGDDADILTVFHDGTPVASLLNLYHGEAGMPYWGGGVRAARGLRANEIMYFEFLNHARRRGCKIADFGRSKLGSGAYSFKKHWGFEPEPLVYAGRSLDPEKTRDVNPNNPRYHLMVRIWQHVPLFAANRVGPWLSRGLG